MSGSGPVRHVLSGLTSQQAAELYSRLLASGSLPIGHGPNQVDIDAAATRELLDAAVLFRSGQDDNLLRPVPPATALRIFLNRRHAELGELQDRIRDGWQRLEGLLPSTIAGGSAGISRVGVEILTDGPRIAALAAELYHSTKTEFRGTETGDFTTRPTAHRGFTPPRVAIESAVRYRYLYQASIHSTAWGRRIIEESMTAGEEIRLRRAMPVKLMHVDMAAALLSVDRAARAALLIRSADVLAMLAEWFDLMWDDPLTTTIGGVPPPDLKPEHLQVLRLLPSADTDAEIARTLNTSITTVRRHVRAIYTALGVNTRFAAGAAATRRGWI